MMDSAIEAKRAYQRDYRKKNREKLNAYRRNWAKENPDKIKEYDRRYWENKALEGVANGEV